MNGNGVRWGKNYFVLGRLEQPRQDKNLFYRQEKLKDTKENPFSFVLFESLFASVSTVSSHCGLTFHQKINYREGG
jgi:hypothetical protein